MLVVYNKIIPFKGFKCINLFGILFARKQLCKVDINHELIHTAQMKELGYIFFYLIYFIEWIIRLFISSNAYRDISFEKEAYSHELDTNYLSKRPKYNMWR